MTIGDRIRATRLAQGIAQIDLANSAHISKQTLYKYESNIITNIPSDKIERIARYLDVTPGYLMGWESGDEPSGAHGFPYPKVTENVVTFPVLGEVAAGYEHIAAEDWSGDTVEIPAQYLHGRPMSDYIVLTVHGDSMYPAYIPGDRVLVLLTPELEYSGQVGLVRYDGELATLKRVEYPETRKWLRLVPINPNYSPRTISDEALADCAIIGVPRLIIRTVQ